MLIYRATNTANSKVYIGATKQTLTRRKSEHRSRAEQGAVGRDVPFFKAIRKYGWDAFVWEVVERCRSIEGLHEAEQRWIKHHNSTSRKCGYNRTDGGGGTAGVTFTAEHRAALSRALTGRPCSPETRAKRSAALKGRKLPIKQRMALRGQKRTPETRAKISAAKKGKPFVLSPEAQTKRLERLRAYMATEANAKLKRGYWPAIKARRAAGESFRAIGESYGVVAATVLLYCRKMEA